MQCVKSVIEYVWSIDGCPNFLKAVQNFMSSSFPETAKYKIKAKVSSAPESLNSDVKFYLVIDTQFNGTCAVYMIKMDTMNTIDNNKHNSVPSASTGSIMSNMSLLYDIKIGNLNKYIYNNTVTLKFVFEIFHQNLISVSHAQSVPLTKVCSTNLHSKHLTEKHLTISMI